jgi:hypothetical protein
MITLEEAKKNGLKIAGTEPYPDFVFSSKAYKADNVWFSNEIENLFNESLHLKNYSNETIKHITYIYLIYPPLWGGVNWPERKYFKRKEKKFFIDIRFPDYERFCKANKQEAMQIMAEQTLRGTKKYLSKVKDFAYEEFYADLLTLFKNEGLVGDIVIENE